MAAITRVKARPVTPVGYEVVSDVRVVTVAVVAGDLLVLTVNGWILSTAANPTYKRGYAAQDYYAGQRDCSVLTTGEMDGWSGMTPGVPLFPDAAGAMNDTPVAGFTGLVHAVSATRIAFTL